jgi:hypothetical protein
MRADTIELAADMESATAASADLESRSIDRTKQETIMVECVTCEVSRAYCRSVRPRRSMVAGLCLRFLLNALADDHLRLVEYRMVAA